MERRLLSLRPGFLTLVPRLKFRRCRLCVRNNRGALLNQGLCGFLGRHGGRGSLWHDGLSWLNGIGSRTLVPRGILPRRVLLWARNVDARLLSLEWLILRITGTFVTRRRAILNVWMRRLPILPALQIAVRVPRPLPIMVAPVILKAELENHQAQEGG